MPIYEFRCRDCGYIQENLVFERTEEEVGPPCPRCGSSATFKVLSVHAAVTTIPREPGHTCCRKQERCESPPCSGHGSCTRG